MMFAPIPASRLTDILLTSSSGQVASIWVTLFSKTLKVNWSHVFTPSFGPVDVEQLTLKIQFFFFLCHEFSQGGRSSSVVTMLGSRGPEACLLGLGTFLPLVVPLILSRFADSP